MKGSIRVRRETHRAGASNVACFESERTRACACVCVCLSLTFLWLSSKHKQRLVVYRM